MRVFMITVGLVLLITSSLFAGANESVRPEVLLEGDAATGKILPGTFVEFRVEAGGFNGVNAVHVDVEYDPAGLRFDSFRAGDLFADPMVLGPFDRSERSVVDVTTATLSGAISVERGGVGFFRFEVLRAERSGLRLVSFQTADEQWQIDTQVSRANALSPASTPTSNRLLGNVPNPFNPTTKIRFALSEPSGVRMEIYGVNGRLVRTLADGPWEAGLHSVIWNGRDEEGDDVSSGIYFVRFRAGNRVETRRMTLLR